MTDDAVGLTAAGESPSTPFECRVKGQWSRLFVGREGKQAGRRELRTAQSIGATAAGEHRGAGNDGRRGWPDCCQRASELP